MQKVKFKYFIYIIPLLIIFGIFFPIINLIKTTLEFDPSKNSISKKSKYSYVITSSDNKILDKLSRKFDINDINSEIPFFIKSSFISAEDKRFFKHNGIDLIGLLRAFISNLRSGYLKEGASTITQQVARLIFLNNDLSFESKIKEIFI